MTFRGFLQRELRIGLELDARTLKAAWVLQRRGGRREWCYREQPRSLDPSPERLRKDLAALLRPLRRHKFTAQVVLAAPNTTIRRLTLHVPDAKRIAGAVREQLPSLLPFDVERAQVRFLIHRQQRIGEEVECLLSLAACERHTLQQDLDALWLLGWAPSGVAPSALALVEAARALKVVGQEPLVLMEIGERRTTIALVDGGEVVYARDVALGDDHLTEALMHQVVLGQGTLSLSREQAEALKQEVGIPDLPAPQSEAAWQAGLGGAQAGSAPSVASQAVGQSGATVGREQIPIATYLAMVQPVLEQLVSEVRRTMTFGSHEATAAMPQRVVISGKGSRLPHCARWLSTQLGVPVTPLSCEEILGTSGSAAGVTCGLALFERPPQLDLQLPSSRQRRAFGRAAALLSRGLTAVALVIWLGTGWWSLQHRAVARTLSELEARAKSLQPVADLQGAIDARTQLVERLVADQGVPVAWFRRLAQDFPNPVRLTRLSIGPKRTVSMEGQAQGRGQSPEAYVSEFALWLERSRICRGTQVGSNRKAETSGNLVEFALTCQLL